MTFACGMCVYYALYLRYPAINSASVILTLWLLALSVARSGNGCRPIRGIPPILLAIPLVVLVWFFAPGTAGPFLGFWIPICVGIGTWDLVTDRNDAKRRRVGGTLAIVAGLCLLGFGSLDYYQFSQLSPEQKLRMTPPWLRPPAAREEAPSSVDAPDRNP